MPLLRILLFALVLLVVTAGTIPTSGGAQEATPAAPQPPVPPTTGPGSSEALFGGMTTIEQAAPDGAQADYWLFVPSAPLPGTPRAGAEFPVVLFVSASTAFTPNLYLAWIEHVVRRGAVVVYPEYQEMTAEETVWRQTLLDDVRRALATLQREDVPVDLTRVAVVGHAAGGVLAIDYAASAAAAGLPIPTAVMGVAPGCLTEQVACLGADPGAIPATTRILLVTEADDLDPGGPPAVERIWTRLAAVPPDLRDVVRLISDVHGQPPLLAGRTQALAALDAALGREGYAPDAYDWYGTWKWLDALMSCAFDGEWCEAALGNTPQQRYMGTWSDGVPVIEPLVTDDPA